MPQRIVLPVDIEIRARDRFRWPEAFPGVIAHGILTSAVVFRICACHGCADGTSHHPLCPAGDLLNLTRGGARRYAIGAVELSDDAFRCRLFLYGLAARSYDRLADVLDALVHHGIGEDRGEVAWCTMSRNGRCFYDTRERIVHFPGEPDSIAAPWLVSTLDGVQKVDFELASPLDLSWKRRPADPASALSPGGLARAFVRRWIALDDGVQPAAAIVVRERAKSWCQAIDAIGGKIENARWFETVRHSARQRREMTFVGLLGTLRPDGESRELTSLAAALDFVPLGGRTAFGFGSVTRHVR